MTYTRECKLDLENVSNELQSKGHSVKVSNSGGEYICNYMYYKNLQCLEERKSNCGATDIHALFVHVPTFKSINEAD